MLTKLGRTMAIYHRRYDLLWVKWEQFWCRWVSVSENYCFSDR